jgi:fatty acid desaturase
VAHRSRTGPARGVDAERPPPQRRPRWGVRTVWLVALAFAGMWTSSLLEGLGAGDAWAGLAGLVAWVGLLGAAYCTYRGLRSASWLPR